MSASSAVEKLGVNDAALRSSAWQVIDILENGWILPWEGDVLFEVAAYGAVSEEGIAENLTAAQSWSSWSQSAINKPSRDIDYLRRLLASVKEDSGLVEAKYPTNCKVERLRFVVPQDDEDTIPHYDRFGLKRSPRQDALREAVAEICRGEREYTAMRRVSGLSSIYFAGGESEDTEHPQVVAIRGSWPYMMSCRVAGSASLVYDMFAYKPLIPSEFRYLLANRPHQLCTSEELEAVDDIVRRGIILLEEAGDQNDEKIRLLRLGLEAKRSKKAKMLAYGEAGLRPLLNLVRWQNAAVLRIEFDLKRMVGVRFLEFAENSMEGGGVVLDWDQSTKPKFLKTRVSGSRWIECKDWTKNCCATFSGRHYVIAPRAELRQLAGVFVRNCKQIMRPSYKFPASYRSVPNTLEGPASLLQPEASPMLHGDQNQIFSPEIKIQDIDDLSESEDDETSTIISHHFWNGHLTLGLVDPSQTSERHEYLYRLEALMKYEQNAKKKFFSTFDHLSGRHDCKLPEINFDALNTAQLKERLLDFEVRVDRMRTLLLNEIDTDEAKAATENALEALRITQRAEDLRLERERCEREERERAAEQQPQQSQPRAKRKHDNSDDDDMPPLIADDEDSYSEDSNAEDSNLDDVPSLAAISDTSSDESLAAPSQPQEAQDNIQRQPQPRQQQLPPRQQPPPRRQRPPQTREAPAASDESNDDGPPSLIDDDESSSDSDS